MPKTLRLVLPHGLMLLATVLLYWAATRIDAGAAGKRIGPDVWPKAIIVFMGLLCAWEIVRRLVLRARPGATGVVEGLARARDEEEPARLHPGMLAWGFALVLGYVLAVGTGGFFATTAAFLAAFSWFGGFRRPVLAVTIGLAGSLLLVVVFMRVAYISLPLGEGPFRALSLALLRLLGVT